VAGYSGELVAGTAIAGGGLVLLVMQQTYAVPLTAQLRLGSVTALDLVRQALTAAALIAGVVAGAGLLVFLAVPIPVGIVVLVATALLIRGHVPLRPRLESSEWRLLAREALPVAIASTVGSFFYRAAILVMSITATAEATGYFSASFRIAEIVLTIPGLITAAAFPIVARAAVDDQSRLAYALQRLFDIAVVAGAGTALLIVFGARPAVDLIAGADFEPSIEVLRVQALGLGISFLVAVWATALWSMRRHRALTWANLGGVALAVALVSALVPAHGARGAAIAMVVAEVVLAAAYAYAVMHDRPDLRPSLHFVPRVLLALTAGGLTWFVPLPDLALLALASVVYVAVLVLVRGVPAEVWDAVRRDA
jgi:O-antigen/teichoic acid export membrane protein